MRVTNNSYRLTNNSYRFAQQALQNVTLQFPLVGSQHLLAQK